MAESAIPLLIMSCSQRKRRYPAPAPFHDVYDGPIWQQVRKSGFPTSRIAAISAMYGLMPPGFLIDHYDKSMDERTACSIKHGHGHIFRMAVCIESAGRAYVVGGNLYQSIVRHAELAIPSLRGLITYATGSYLQQRKQLAAFLQSAST